MFDVCVRNARGVRRHWNALGNFRPVALTASLDLSNQCSFRSSVALVLLAVFLSFILPKVGEILQEQHRKDVVLVLGWIDRATKRIARLPNDRVDFRLRKFLCHIFVG